ncbi:hypothetical protein CIK84_14990 [Glutamicibacter arilaitensis]|uniref:Uncharacterized protein n=1 Tax=Glutamicibacter arilaitensis TaxID=256701 RepID=A0A2N7S1A3_9MICC|nr:hypothetical protein CIK84_14990 [Glutamicibacter arilaitensis]
MIWKWVATLHPWESEIDQRWLIWKWVATLHPWESEIDQRWLIWKWVATLHPWESEIDQRWSISKWGSSPKSAGSTLVVSAGKLVDTGSRLFVQIRAGDTVPPRS